ncbi:MAG: sulfatase [Isosphaeraceae bacterium]|nr:sulfatase [Isosphaeraceae bacterium]
MRIFAPLALCAAILAAPGADAADRPNILWIFVDDMSANFGCYGETTIATPEVDRLAEQGTRFARAYVTAPVCSPCRSALITGRYQTSIGAHHHRSGRGEIPIRLPAGVVPVPRIFRDAGYHTSNSSWPVAKNLGKTDYNFEWDPKIYDGVDWSTRKPNQPFFAQIQLHGGKHRDGRGLQPRVLAAIGSRTDPAKVVLPPYYPDVPAIRQDWADYLDAVRYTDLQVGEILARLDSEGLAASTVVFFMTDHGISHARGKQFLYDEGIHVPLIIRGPGVPARALRIDLVEHIDLAATSLALAGIPIPFAMQGKDILAADYEPRTAVFAARDRCDETVDRIRSVRTADFKYIRNYLPDRPHLQPNEYKDNKPTYKAIRALHAEGKLTGLPLELLMAPKRAPEELYDLANDPFELRNLAADPARAAELEAMRIRLSAWEAASNDMGRTPESDAMYDSDMALYLRSRTGRPAAGDKLRDNIDLMKRWKKEGK